MQYDIKKSEKEAVLSVAKLMVAAAKTAPKAKGVDDVACAILDSEDLLRVEAVMKELQVKLGARTFVRDAENIANSSCLVLLGARNLPIGLGKTCGLCGHKDCEGCQAEKGLCTHNIADLGIALGAAVAVANTHHIDNRIMFSAGKAAIKMGVFDNDVQVVYGIPLSVSTKSVYFDR
jgi:uncharacterized ferredoxin-like protein